jgi:hypothetical protein
VVAHLNGWRSKTLARLVHNQATFSGMVK